jgi:hypothetical protein
MILPPFFGKLALRAALCAAVMTTGAAGATFRAGAAALDITPLELPVRVAGGFLEKTGAEVRDRLHVRCVVLDDGRSRLVFAVVDTCMMPYELIEKAKRQASAACGIPVTQMLVSATHTHSAPAAMGCLGTRVDEKYAAWLPGRIAEGIVAAAKNLQPAQIGWAAIDDWEHTHNRRWIRQPEAKVVDPFGEATGLAHMHPGHLSKAIIGPSGPVDPGLSVLAVRTPEGRPVAVLANYSQHYFISGASQVSSDYYGLFCRQVARMLGQEGEGNGPFVCAMTQGTSGDLMWMDYGAPKKVMTVDAYAEAVAANAMKALAQIKYQSHVTLGAVEKKLRLNYRVPDEKRLQWARPIAARILDDRPKSQIEVYAQEALILHERQQTELTLQAIRIGDLTIAAIPNEVYAITGLKLKAQSPGGAHFNVSLANGAEGYIPPPEQHALGGYTTWPARTAGLEVQAEPKIVATLLSALEEVTGRPRRGRPDEHGPYARAILDAKPAAYWRLNEAAGTLALNSVPGGTAAEVSEGWAWYLPGAGSGSGTGAGEALTPSAYSGPRQINRAVHLAGGEVRAELAGVGDSYSIALWFWLGEASGASERSGVLLTGPGGESLICRQDQAHEVRLELAGTETPVSRRADEWHFAVLVRDKGQLRVYLDGGPDPKIACSLPMQKHGRRLTFGSGLQGKIDEIAVFARPLGPSEIAGFWQVSGVGDRPFP